MTRLTVLRHAKSAWPEGMADASRPLADRGRRDAPAAGRLIAAGDPVDLALCSPATRTRQTWDLVSAELPTPPPMRLDPRIYEADVAGLLGILRTLEPQVAHLLLIGHNPASADLVLRLAGSSAPELTAQVARKFPTAAVAVLQTPPWPHLAPGTGQLLSVSVPRG